MSVQDNHVGNTTLTQDKLKATLLDFVRGGSDNLSLGAGYCHPFPDQVCMVLNAQAEKEKNKDKTHRTMLKQIQDRIDDLRAQIEVLQAKIDDLNEEKAENKDQVAKNKERMAELKAQGKGDSAEYQALLMANNALDDRNDDIDGLISDHQNHIDNLNDRVDDLLDAQATNDPDVMQAAVEQSSNAESYYAADTNDSLSKALGAEYTQRANEGSNITTGVSLGIDVQEADFDDFLGEDLFPAAEELEIAANFAKAASGDAQPPNIEQEVTPENQILQISMNV